MTQPKPFQTATIQAALQSFLPTNGPRRFLVADEVGLGKTVVAQGIIRELMQAKRGPLIVFYVCSSLSIASQNQTKLLEILPETERGKARCTVDRLTLMPAAELPTHPKLRLFTLTPETSVPIRAGQRRDGRKEERALIHALIKELYPEFFVGRDSTFFRRYVSTNRWREAVSWQQQRVRKNQKLREAFRKSMRMEFQLDSGQHLLSALKAIEDPLTLIAHLRNALALSALDEIKPDLVIFDEFQRFRDLLDTEIDEAAARIIAKLRGDTLANPPALLLLSATPYRLYSRRSEEALGSAHHQEFFKLVEFLYRDKQLAQQKKAECEAGLAELAQELHRGQPNSTVATAARNRVQKILQPVMARTERASYQIYGTEDKFAHLLAELHPDDLRVYRHLSESLADNDRTSAVAFWTSIPLPMQTMGNDYVTWRRARSMSAQGVPALSEKERDQIQAKEDWSHPRLRSLKEHLITSDQLALPWLSPSLPWWNLAGAWEKANECSKLLIFSRFRAVPQAIAALLSYDLESYLLAADEKLKYADVTKRKALQAKADRYPLLALFHPSPWLIESTDPLSANSNSLLQIRPHLRSQIEQALKKLGLPIVETSASKPNLLERIRGSQDHKRPVWQLLAQIEKRARYGWTLDDWWDLHRTLQRQENPDAGLGQLLQRWEQEADGRLEHITPDEVNELVEYALSAPGVIVGRALRRHWSEAVTAKGFKITLNVVWNGLRTYLDQRWFFTALKSQDDETYPEAIRQAVIDGNLEAVLDEYLWIIHQIRSLSGEALARELKESLSIRAGRFNLHQAGNPAAKTFSLRCHAALPFIQTQTQTLVTYSDDGTEREQPFRPDDLRKSFNSPFWPHVLATTSVGQEGLDFHVWCRRLVHWDLCSNPVDLEQREGRIQRYGGLAIRQVIAAKLGQEALQSIARGQSPWQKLGQLADQRLGDSSGLVPWWVYDGAGIQRFLFDVPFSEQAYRLEWLKQQRLLYRLVLGQPNQEDLIEILAQQEVDIEDVRQAMLQLSPWFGTRNDGL